MAKLISEEKKANKYTAKLVLGSIRTWKEAGVECEVTNISKIFEDKYRRPTVAITIKLLQRMPKIRARKIEDGKVVKKYDEVLDKDIEVIEILEDVSEVEVPIYYNLTIDKESDPENPEFHIYNTSKFYPLVNYAYQVAEILDEGNTKSFTTDYEELKEGLGVLSDDIFLATIESREYNNNKYDVLIPKPVYEEMVVEG